MKKELSVSEALEYLLFRDKKLAMYISRAAGVSMKFSEDLVKQIADKLSGEMKKSVVDTVRREAHLHDLISLQQRIIQKFRSDLSNLEDHVSQLKDQDSWNKVCDELNRPDLKAVYV